MRSEFVKRMMNESITNENKIKQSCTIQKPNDSQKRFEQAIAQFKVKESNNKIIDCSNNKIEQPKKIVKEIKAEKEEPIVEYKVKLNKHGFSTNKMYYARGNEFKRTAQYNYWADELKEEMRKQIGNKKIFHAITNKPMKIDICFGVEERYDVDNMIKSFLDTLVSYYGLKNDNGFYEINMKKEIVKTREEGYIAFNITNIAA